MEVTRRGFLKGMAGILAAGVAPAFIGSKVLMPIKPALVLPPTGLYVHNGSAWMRITAIEHNGVEREIDPVTLYRGDSKTIELPGCAGQVIAYNVTWNQTFPL